MAETIEFNGQAGRGARLPRDPVDRGPAGRLVSLPSRVWRSPSPPRRLSVRDRSTGGTSTAAQSTARIKRTGMANGSPPLFACYRR